MTFKIKKTRCKVLWPAMWSIVNKKIKLESKRKLLSSFKSDMRRPLRIMRSWRFCSIYKTTNPPLRRWRLCLKKIRGTNSSRSSISRGEIDWRSCKDNWLESRKKTKKRYRESWRSWVRSRLRRKRSPRTMVIIGLRSFWITYAWNWESPAKKIYFPLSSLNWINSIVS